MEIAHKFIKTNGINMHLATAGEGPWEWAGKPVDNKPTIDAAVYDAVMALPPDERRDRAKVNAALRDGLRFGPLRPAGSADLYGVPKAKA